MTARLAVIAICAAFPTLAAAGIDSPNAGEKATMLRWTVGCPGKEDFEILDLIRKDHPGEAKRLEKSRSCALVRGGADVLIEKTSWGGGPSCVRESEKKACVWVASEHIGPRMAPIVDPVTIRQFGR